MSNRLLIVTAVVEVGTGIALLIAPSWVVALLVGDGLTLPQSFVLGRITGAALISTGAVCWLARMGESHEQQALINGLLIYNLAVPALLLHAAIAVRLRGVALWPVVVLHVGLAIWCMLCLRRR
jgi:hypothetical protein